MKKVECNFFKNGEYLMFNMQRLMEFEAAVGQPIGELLQMSIWPINSIITGYAIGMKQHKRNAQQYYELFDELLSDETKDMSLLSLQAPLMQAIIASGALGSKMYYQMYPNELTPDDKVAIENEAEQAKNQRGAKLPPLFLYGYEMPKKQHIACQSSNHGNLCDCSLWSIESWLEVMNVGKSYRTQTELSGWLTS